jgi:hypothetical protein
MITLSDHSPSFKFIANLTTTTAYGITACKTASAKSPIEMNRKGKAEWKKKKGKENW